MTSDFKALAAIYEESTTGAGLRVPETVAESMWPLWDRKPEVACQVSLWHLMVSLGRLFEEQAIHLLDGEAAVNGYRLPGYVGRILGCQEQYCRCCLLCFAVSF